MQSPSLELKNSLVRAGAGAGKTTGLVDKVVSVYRAAKQKGLPAPRIVLTTFTRKATQELKERLILRACKEKDADLLQFASDPAHLYIATIHGLLNTFLKTVGHLAGLDSGFQIINPGEASHLARLAFRQVLVNDPAHLEWIESYGFDRTLEMCRAYDLALREAGSLTPATLEDIEQLASAMRARWRDALVQLTDDILSETDDKKWVAYAEKVRDFALQWCEGKADIKDLVQRRGLTKLEELAALDEHVAMTMDSFKKEAKLPAWNPQLWPVMVRAWQTFQPLAAAFSAELTQVKESQGRYEMADLELKALEILRDKPFVAGVFSEAWDFWMIDEYQDTSPVQVAILAALIGAKPRYYVGDPQQSIYLFRGAEVRVFDEAEGEVKAGGGDIVELLKNYRSQPELLMWINDFMASFSQAFLRMQPRAETGTVAQPVARLTRAADEAAEMRALVARVGELVSEGASLDQICVLGRTHNNLMEVSRLLKSYGYPTHVHSSRGYNSRREVLDAQALWKFLLNPHDNLNLLLLLRSPWFFFEDWQLVEWMSDRPKSLWRKLSLAESPPDAIMRLKSARMKSDAQGLARTFEDVLCSAEFLDLSLVNDPAGRKESNLWKLVHKARRLEKEGGSSVLNLTGSEREDPLDLNEGDATSAQEPNSINLMTVHGSKGLQFDHILMSGLGDTAKLSNTTSFGSADGKFFFPTWLESEEESPFIASPLDQAALRKKRGREIEEYDRLLYVAVTRAKESVSLFWSEPRKESWADRSPLFQKPPGVYREKSYTFEVRDGEPVDPVPYVSKLQPRDVPREPWRDLKNESEKESRHSVTELVEKSRPKQVSSGDLVKRWQAQALGTNLHRQFEGLKYHRAPGQETDPALKFVLSVEAPPMKPLIQDGFTEWGFQVRTATGVVEGQIDLWGKSDGKLYVIDYKTGSAAYQEAAFEQLGLYAWALRKFGHTEPVELAVIYPLTKKVECRAFTPELFAGWERKFSGT